MSERKSPTVDLTGQVFNQLTVLSFSHYSEKGYPYWLCQCDCGTVKAIAQYDFTHRNTKSCGCRRAKRGKNLHNSNLTVYEGVQIERALAQTLQKNNTSGFRGVSKSSSGDRWRANLTFKGVRYHLGYYKKFEDAVAARLRGEEMVDDFINQYFHNVMENGDTEKVKQAKEAFENHVMAKAKAEDDFRRVVCSGKACSTIAVDMTIMGGVMVTGPLLVAGCVNGDIESTGAVMINGKVYGNVHAPLVYVPNGVVEGTITAMTVYCSNTNEQIIGTVSGEIKPYCRLDND